MAKQVTFYLSRRLTLQREGKEDVILKAGANVVDEDVAEHGFVKAHMTNEPVLVSSAELDAANAKIAELTAALAEANTKVSDLSAELDAGKITIQAYEATASADGKKK